MIFEGEYLNGDKHGKVKEYDSNGKLRFEGEYFNGQKHGKVKEYDYYGKLFEGEYLNGVKNGKAKEYYREGKLEFEGEYKNGEKYGKRYNSDGKLLFEGEFKDDKYWIGKEFIELDGEYTDDKYSKIKPLLEKNFEIEYLNGIKWSGKNYEINNNEDRLSINTYIEGKNYQTEYDLEGNIIFEGEISDDESEQPNKKGKFYVNKKLKLEGEYFDKRLNGKIKKYYENGKLKTEGNYNMGTKEGKFKKYYDNGNLKLEGQYEFGALYDYVKKYYSNGNLSFEGEYKNGLKNGKGKEYYKNFKLKFEGEYLNGSKWIGIEYDIKGEKILDIKEGNGKGKEYDENGNLIFEGEYYQGKKWYGYIYDNINGKKKYKIINGNGCEDKAKDSWFFGESYSNGFKTKQEFHKNGKIKFEGIYIGDDKWEGKKYDKNGENEKKIIAGKNQDSRIDFCLIC